MIWKMILKSLQKTLESIFTNGINDMVKYVDDGVDDMIHYVGVGVDDMEKIVHSAT